MDTKKWPMLVDWEEIFGNDRATEEFAKGSLDAVEEIQRSQSLGLFNNMSLGFPIDLDGYEKAGSSHRPNMTSGETENVTVAAAFPGASQNENVDAFEPEKAESQQTNKQGYGGGYNFFTDSQDRRMGALIDKIGNRDKSDLRDQIYSIIESPIFELYSTEKRIKPIMVLCDGVKKLELFICMGELEHQTMMFMIINVKL
ncbi:hypothetical protein RDI58_026898 [Solanum bulbocastanum]|uniref:Uncharacterized protein n=1 Tax=Solanum bulbocastanum TaxID=147425 RepID=A0AAN8SX79_SOLBU